MSKSKIKVCAILWRDAGYTYGKKIPTFPHLQLTVGFIIEANDEFTNIAMNVGHDPKTKKLWPIDGFIIPKKAIVKSEIIYSLDDESKKK